MAEHWLHKPGVLDSIPGGCQSFHFPLFLAFSMCCSHFSDPISYVPLPCTEYKGPVAEELAHMKTLGVMLIMD